MPQGFDFPQQAALWQSAGTRTPPRPLQYPQGGFRILARLKPGVSAALSSTRLLTSFLFGTTPTDLTVFIATALVLSVAALTAFFVPARRAARIDPAMVLRAE
jgi:hypothetical protein